jgi:hypothetical protein
VIVSRILHAGYIFESAGVRIAFDPVLEIPFSTNCFPFPDLTFSAEATRPASFLAADAAVSPIHSYDAVFISHFHDDHCSLVSLDFIPRSVPIYLYCVHDELFEFLRVMGFSVFALRVDGAIQVGGFTVTPRLALDPDVDTVFEICAEGLSVLNVVDAWIDPSILRLRSAWDLVLWPFQTMRELEALMPGAAVASDPALGSERAVTNESAVTTKSASAEAPLPECSLPPEWVEQISQLGARFLVPSSCQIRFEEWSWLNHAFFPITYAQFAREIPSSVRMNPGESFELNAQSFTRVGRLPWVTSIGAQDVDYDYGPHVEPTPTSESAKRFPALTAEERSVVDRFCAGLDVTLYDHEGRPASAAPGSALAPVRPSHSASASRATEAIAYKVFRAITEGEQITSMYLRTPDIENDALIAKLSLDPLAFQRAQLRRWLARKRPCDVT